MRGICLIIIALATAGCETASPTVSSPTVEGAAPTRPPAGGGCPTIDLSTPSGARIDLTGTWTGPMNMQGLPYVLRYVRQFGECVWWEDVSSLPGEQPGDTYRRLFAGTVRPDFNAVGRFAEIYSFNPFDPSGESHHPLFGEEVWEITFEGSGEREVVNLVGPSIETDTLSGSFDTWVFARISYSTEAVTPE